MQGHSLRKYAAEVNRRVTTWWRTEFSDASAGAFTLHDYFLGTDMVRTAIDANVGRGLRARQEAERSVAYNVTVELIL